MGRTLISTDSVYLTAPEPTTADERNYFTNESIAADQGGGVAEAPTREERKAYREMFLGENASNALRFEAQMTRRCGPAAGMLARQLLFWEGRGQNPSGWIYKSIPEIQEELGLSRRQQEKATKVLVSKGLVEQDTFPGPDGRERRHYRLNLLALLDFLDGSPERTLPANSEQGPGSLVPDRVPAQYSDPRIQERTHEITQEIPSGGEPPEPEPSTTTPQDAGEHPVGDNVISLSESRPPKGSSEVAVSNLVRGIEDAGGRITRSSRGKYGKAFNRLVEGEGVTEEELEKVVARIVARWPEREISADWALSDVLNGRAESEKGSRSPSETSAGSATPEPALSALKEDHKYGRYAKAAERHDFTSRQEPDWKILQSLGGTEQERRDNARLMGNVARRAMREAESDSSGGAGESTSGSFREDYGWFFDKPVSGKKQMFDN